MNNPNDSLFDFERFNNSIEEEVDVDYDDSRLKPIIRTSPKFGRNERCPCGSGKKFKKCCIRKEVGHP